MSVIAPSTKEQIVLVAERLFAERGIEGVSLRQIGAAAGNGNNSAVQYHFGSKDHLVQAVFEYRLPRLNERGSFVIAERHPDDLRSWVECGIRVLLEQSELEDSNYMSFVATLYQYGRRDVFEQVPHRIPRRDQDVPRPSGGLHGPRRRAAAYAPDRPGLGAHRPCRVRPRAGPRDRPVRCCPSRSRSATSSTAWWGSSKRPSRAASQRRARACRSCPCHVADGPLTHGKWSHEPSRRCSGLHRSAGSRRSGAVRAQRLSGRRVDPAARRGARRLLRAAGLPAVLGDHEARRHRGGRIATGGVLESSTASS